MGRYAPCARAGIGNAGGRISGRISVVTRRTVEFTFDLRSAAGNGRWGCQGRRGRENGIFLEIVVFFFNRNGVLIILIRTAERPWGSGQRKDASIDTDIDLDSGWWMSEEAERPAPFLRFSDRDQDPSRQGGSTCGRELGLSARLAVSGDRSSESR